MTPNAANQTFPTLSMFQTFRLLANGRKFSEFETEMESLKNHLKAEKANNVEFANLIRKLKRKLLLVSKVLRKLSDLMKRLGLSLCCDFVILVWLLRKRMNYSLPVTIFS